MSKKLKEAALMHAAESIGPLVLRSWIGSLRTKVVSESPKPHFLRTDFEGSYLYAVWHEVLLLPALLASIRHPYVVISNSRDGSYITRIAEGLGWNVLRGSSSRGAFSVVRQILEAHKQGDIVNLAFTIDGPRGPRREAKGGLAYVSAQTRLPIIAVGSAHDRPWRAKSWDRFVLPRPFSKAAMYLSEPIAPPRSTSESDVEATRLVLQSEMTRVTAAAESIVAGEQAAKFVRKAA
ncbi:hypothetical protein Pan216_23020 [Planctomycetes bacterium Pan216]|uniref:DUF374 domain-containing protein n=1 Tax=Kolteria novifilia TaxID=2527975 RepID=A0A518B394_9BACT|nr:hypothetical protein Pan216_23020 [Planctomycetes bacterium Pan216]